jgi:hypothetical protein
MSFDLRNPSGERFRFSSSGWGYYLNLAKEYGWQAAGTLPPDGMPDSDGWPKSYDSNDGQWVSAEDAGELAGALQAALDDARRVERLTLAAQAESKALSHATGRPCQVRVESNDEEYIRQMIEFFRKGKFQIG